MRYRWNTKKWKKNGRKWSILFLIFCASLCGCDSAVQSRLSALSDALSAPFKQYQIQDVALPSLSELLKGPEPDDFGSPENLPQEAADEPEAEPTLSLQPEESISVRLFFLTPDGTELLEEAREIAKVPGIARATLQALLDGPQNQEAAALFPESTALKDIHITENGICRLDFSREIQGIVSAEREEMVTLAIIKTLSQFPRIEAVQFMVEGQAVNSLTGRTESGGQ